MEGSDAFSPLPAPVGTAGTPETPADHMVMRRSLTPTENKLIIRQQNRRAAAEWISAVTGVNVPAGEESDFRSALADGVILCKLINALQPNTISKVIDGGKDSETGEIIQTFENVSNFIKAASSLTQDTFSAADLASPEGADAVANCVLALRDWHENRFLLAEREHRASLGRSPTALGLPSPVGSLPSPEKTTSPTAGHFSFTPQAQAVVAKHGSSVAAADGVSYLMRSCNNLMKSHMGLPATPLPPPPKGSTGATSSEIALDAVGPVLETVIQNLTTEYEKRLLAKDQEFKQAQEERARLRKQIAGLQSEVEAWRQHAEVAAAASASAAGEAVEELSAAQREEYERLLEAQAAVESELARREEEMLQMESQYREQAEVADAELAELREEVENYRDLHERYCVMQEENRALYNTVQDLRGNIRVFCRVRPRGATGDNSMPVVEVEEEQAVNVFSHKHNKWHSFKFDRVFGEESTQDDVYEETKPLIRSVLDGYNVCIFAYGQTGSGKTHTMSGTNIEAYEGRGINFRALDDLFQLNHERRAEVEYDIRVQLLEIYNESLRDLLVSEAEAKQQRSLALQNTQRSGSNVPDAIQVPVASTEEVLRVMDLGARNRAVAETRMNERSSRSHQVLTVMVDGVNKITHARTHGCLHLIDLAGSERVGKSGAQGQQLLEAQHINKSLSSLGSVMHALASKSAHVPFRDSKLTQLLQDSLSGQAKSMMFMHVAPEMSSASETLSTLNFGRNVTEITLGQAKKNTESGSLVDAKDRLRRAEAEASAARQALVAEQERASQLQAEVEALRGKLARAATASTAQSSPVASDSEPELSISAFRPGTHAARQAGVAALMQQGHDGGSASPAARSRLQLPGSAARSSTLTPQGSAGGRGLTPRGSGSLTPRSGSAPTQVSRLNLSSTAARATPPSASDKAGSAGSGLRPPMSKLNLSKLQSDSHENKTPGSARLSLSKIPVPSPAAGAGSMTARPSMGKASSTSSIPRAGSMSARDSPADVIARKNSSAAAARSSSIRQVSSAGGAATGNGSLNSARRSLAGNEASRIGGVQRRTTGGEAASTGSLNSARGIRSSVSAAKRWA